MAVVEQKYRYLGESSALTADEQRDTYISTSGGESSNPFLFSGFLSEGRSEALLLLAVAKIAGRRYFTPAATVAARVRAADPVLTSDGEKLRLESFSACNGVYARVDLAPSGGDAGGRGTTNVDFNPPFQHTLADIRRDEVVHLCVGPDEVRLARLSGTVVERRVRLPERWLRGFGEVAGATSGMTTFADFNGPGAKRALSLLARAAGNRPVWLSTAGRTGFEILDQEADASIAVDGLDRLRTLTEVTAGARRLRLLAGERDSMGGQAVAAEVEYGTHRVTLVVSATRPRGFSGEGSVLTRLTDSRATALASSVLSELTAHGDQSVEAMASRLGIEADLVERALSVLAAQGQSGYDQAERRWFARTLPFDVPPVERLHPRLREARTLVEGNSVDVARTEAGAHAQVRSGEATYDVALVGNRYTCTCEWFTSNGSARGPCKHVIAAMLVSETATGPGQ